MLPKSERLLQLTALLRERRTPSTAAELAAKLNVSLRTLYRDIAALRRQGADIRGEAGIGYQLHGGYLLPPLTFNGGEIEAVVFGMRWAAACADDGLAQQARSALVKIQAVLPEHLQHRFAEQTLFPLSSNPNYTAEENRNLVQIRAAIAQNRMLAFDYTDLQGKPSRRSVYPLAVGYFAEARVLAAWCTLRQDFRHFRADRMARLCIGEPLPLPRMLLLKKWRQQENVDLAQFGL